MRVLRTILIHMDIKRFICQLLGSSAEASHIKDGNTHIVEIRAMRVLIVKDTNDAWFAQCIDLDYATQGSTIDEAKSNFEKGLTLTIKAHLDRFGTIDHFMKAPPIEAWLPLISSDHRVFNFSNVSAHDLPEIPGIAQFPFSSLEYIHSDTRAA